MKNMPEVSANVNVYLEVADIATGEIIHTEETHNRVTNVGLNLIRDLLTNNTSDRITHMAFGSGTAAASTGDTTLLEEVFRDSITSTDVSNPASVQFRHFLSAASANGHTITELGLFTDAVAGKMFARVLISPIVKTTQVSINLYWTINLASVA